MNWGIIAPGRIADRFAQDLALVDGARLHAVASRSLDRAKAFAARYGAAHAYGSYEEILSCPGLDVVYVASPHARHCAHARMCLENGLPVLCEKPLALNLAQAQVVVAAARASGTFLMEALWTRFIPAFEEALKRLGAGAIGKIRTVRADFGFQAFFSPDRPMFNTAMGGGALLEVGMYPVFLALLLLGRPDHIKALATLGPTGVDESFAILFQYASGQLAILDVSCAVKTGTEAFVHGDRGTLRLHRHFHHPTRLSIDVHGASVEHLERPHLGHGYAHEIREVMECLRLGRRESDKLPLESSLLIMEMLDAIRREAGVRYDYGGLTGPD